MIHIHGVFHHVTTLAAAEARRRSIPYLIRPCGCLDSQCLELGSHRLKRVFTRVVLQRDLRHAAWVHPASQHEADELRPWVAPQRIRVIPHGIEIPEYDSRAASQAFLARFPKLSGRRVILFMSRITAKKRPELIVDAMARLRSEYPDLVLVLAGGDEGQMAVVEAAAQRQGVGDAVVHVGFLQGELKHGAFAAAQLFALPSIDENFGLAPLEAVAHGVPALVTPGVASHVYVDQSGAGITVEGTAESVAEGIRTLLGADGRAMGQKGREFLRQHLSWSAAVRQIDDLYRQALGNANRDGSRDRSGN